MINDFCSCSSFDDGVLISMNMHCFFVFNLVAFS